MGEVPDLLDVAKKEQRANTVQIALMISSLK